jgi:hypothetical protein
VSDLEPVHCGSGSIKLDFAKRFKTHPRGQSITKYGHIPPGGGGGGVERRIGQTKKT